MLLGQLRSAHGERLLEPHRRNEDLREHHGRCLAPTQARAHLGGLLEKTFGIYLRVPGWNGLRELAADEAIDLFLEEGTLGIWNHLQDRRRYGVTLRAPYVCSARAAL